MLNFGQYVGFFNKSNQENKIAIPITTQEEIKIALNHTYEVKPAAYKNINSSSMNINNIKN
jgi:hypothetical protein